MDPISELDQTEFSNRQGDSHHLRQLCHSQTHQGRRLAQTQQTLSHSLHADLRLLAEHGRAFLRSEEHTSELQSLTNLVCRLLLEKKKKKNQKKYQNRY